MKPPIDNLIAKAIIILVLVPHFSLATEIFLRKGPNKNLLKMFKKIGITKVTALTKN